MPFRSFSRYALAATACIAIAGCSNGFRSLPMTSEQSPQSAMTRVATPITASIERVGDALTIFATSACKKPTFPLICVNQGGKGTLSIKLTCKKGTVPVSCGTVDWKTKTNNKGLKGSFKPDPGNPTKETITASPTIKPGNYKQTIAFTCSACTSAGKQSAPITVLKK